MSRGMIQKFFFLKGYGWIVVDFKTRLFFHVNQWKSNTPPRIGETVTFDIAPPQKPGQCNQAINVTPATAQVESMGGGAQ